MKEVLEALIAEMIGKGIRLDEVLGEFEAHFIRRTLARHQGNPSLAARALGMHRNTLSRKLAALHRSAARRS
ncbi:MAG: helix-turn-helix domain-containing protein [Terriglobales bacterium]